MKGEEAKTFITRVQVGFRIQIPEPVRSLLGIAEDDIVEVSIRKLKKEEKTTETKFPSASGTPTENLNKKHY